MLRRAFPRLAALAVVALSMASCNDGPTSPGASGSIADFVASASIGGTDGAMQTEAIPRPSDGPVVTVNGHLTIVNGGTATVTVTSPTPFTKVYVAGSAPVSRLFTPVSGFYEVQLPISVTSAELLLVFPQALPSANFNLYFSAADSSGHVGTVSQRSVRAFVVGTGDIQVTASWDTDSDVDIHVVDPSGQEVFWGNRSSSNGGQLDLDSNAACAIDSVRNEDITWPVGAAPQGTYTVRLDYWSNCGASQTNYTVLVNNGGDVHIFEGAFTGSGDQGTSGSGIQITTFTRTTGPLPAPPPSGFQRHPTSKGWSG